MRLAAMLAFKDENTSEIKFKYIKITEESDCFGESVLKLKGIVEETIKNENLDAVGFTLSVDKFDEIAPEIKEEIDN